MAKREDPDQGSDAPRLNEQKARRVGFVTVYPRWDRGPRRLLRRADGSVGRILVVEDEPELRFMLRRVFTRAGHEVTEAGNGAAALALVHEAPPDLVVTDIMMPVMDGVELICRLRADPSTAAIPILSVSGDWQLAVAADAALAKPYRSAEVLTVAEGLLEKGRGTR